MCPEPVMVEEDLAVGAPPDEVGRRLDALVETAHTQLREVVERATAEAQADLEAAIAAVAEREKEIAALLAGVAAERVHLVADRESLEARTADVLERERAVDGAAEEVAELREQATVALASALERAARLTEEAEAQAREHQARARTEIDAERRAARERAEEIHAQLARRLEAVGKESEAILQRAVDRGLMIVSAAEDSAARSKAELRRVVTQIETFLEREPVEIGFDTESRIDLREPAGARSEPAPHRAPGNWPESDFEPLPVPSGGADNRAVAESPADDPQIVDPAEQHVADAVRRAVRDWSVSRNGANDLA
jgi:hypothetical protein